MLIPSDDYPNALRALEEIIVDQAVVRAAVAFVTESGVRALAGVLSGRENVTLQVFARAGDATEPQALLSLRDELNAEVWVVIGKHARAFHPKLWLVEDDRDLVVLAGSGNLTAAGLMTNDEQFDVARFELDSVAAQAQVDRLGQLTRNALPLEQVVGTTIWHEWLAVISRQDQLRRQLAAIERQLNLREPAADRSEDKARLIDDLQALYDATVAAGLRRADGGLYAPTRLLDGIRRARAGVRDPVQLVADVIRKRTGGFDILLNANAVELTLEYLVLDASKPYRDLWTDRSRELARERVAMFTARE
jgi:HKD family nuclease